MPGMDLPGVNHPQPALRRACSAKRIKRADGGVGVPPASPKCEAVGNDKERSGRGRGSPVPGSPRNQNVSEDQKRESKPCPQEPARLQGETINEARTAKSVRVAGFGRRELRFWGGARCKRNAGPSDRQEQGPDSVGRSRHELARATADLLTVCQESKGASSQQPVAAGWPRPC